MYPMWLTTVSIAALALGVLGAALIAVDIAAGHRQKMAIMNIVWPTTALYFGPLGVLAYWRTGRTPHGEPAEDECRPGKAQGNSMSHSMSMEHRREKPFWQKVFVSTSHCGAGCSVGDVAGEWLLFLTGFTILGSALLTAYAVDFVLAYILGIIFQFFAIAPMRNLGPREGITAAIKADTLSLIAFEIGMFGWMALTRLVLFQPPLEANNPVYWFMMQIAMVIGFLTSYPANWFLVKQGIKEAM